MEKKGKEKVKSGKDKKENKLIGKRPPVWEDHHDNEITARK
jgi:hypothetical protein